ncbi:hypothetical protein G7Z17_g2358 [Cylindrodendrum hubeiense]|uniref:NB-ARC domain-containing protein n=1 Tax=Cylindrodendrum hubeiense TaxID=595255 RepID=A0A9P5HKZ7_9HYPO|nr:hypothetical protein G7Z17_g2358 [Cylindrodendrum hubeiense]
MGHSSEDADLVTTTSTANPADVSTPRQHKPFSTLPFPPDPTFVDRPEILDWLHARCAQPAARVALVGPGGIGKSQLAIQYARKTLEQSPDKSVFWVPASNRGRFEEAYHFLAGRLQLPGRKDFTKVLSSVTKWLSNDESGSWVMILDDVDDGDIFLTTQQLAEFIPQSPSGSIILTSRNVNAAGGLVDGRKNIFNVPAMESNESCKILKEKLGDKYDDEAATELASTLQHIPLALAQAAAFINQQEPPISISTYKEEFQSHDKNSNALYLDANHLCRAPISVATTLQITFEQIRRERPSAADLLVFMSFCNPQGIHKSVLQAYTLRGEDTTDDPNEDHKDDLDDDLGYQGKREEAVQICRQAVESSKRVLGACDTDTMAMTSVLASLLHDQNRLEEAEKTYRQVWEAREKVSGSFHRDTLSTISVLALVLYHQGKYKGAEQLYRHAYEAMETYLGKDDRDTLESINNLASALYIQGKFEEAEQIYRKARGAMERVLGNNHPETLRSINDLASTIRAQGRWKESEVLFKQVMEIRETVLGPEHPDTLTSMANLALTYGRQGRWREAAVLGSEVIEARERVIGEDHPDTITSMANLAATFGNEGQWKEARELFSRVMDVRKRVLGEEHPDTITSIANLAATFGKEGRWKEAEELFSRVMQARKKILGEEHPDTINTIANLASTYQDQGRWREAERLGLQVLEVRKRVMGDDHPDTVFFRSILERWKGTGNRVQIHETEDSDVATSSVSYSWPDQPDSTNPSSPPYAGTMDRDQVEKSSPPTTFFNYKMPEIERKPNKRDENDIQSIESISDDIESLAESQSAIANYREAAVKYIVSKFAANSGLLALYQEAAQSMGEAKFVRNHRRLLKRLLLDLCHEGKTPSQKSAVEFLRSRSKRTHISLGIRNLVMPSDNSIREEVTLMLRQEKDNLFLLNRLLGEKDLALRPAPTDPISQNEPIIHFLDLDRDSASERSDSEDSSMDGFESCDENEIEIREDAVLSNLEATAEFLTSGRPFDLYRENLHRFLHSLPITANAQDKLQLDAAQVAAAAPENPLQDNDNKENDKRADFLMADEEPSMPRSSSLWLWFMSIYSPPPVGYQRLPYTCAVEKFAPSMFESYHPVESKGFGGGSLAVSLLSRGQRVCPLQVTQHLHLKLI